MLDRDVAGIDRIILKKNAMEGGKRNVRSGDPDYERLCEKR